MVTFVWASAIGTCDPRNKVSAMASENSRAVLILIVSSLSKHFICELVLGFEASYRAHANLSIMHGIKFIGLLVRRLEA
jgi:hypothetical protein